MVALFWMNYKDNDGYILAEDENHPAGDRLDTPSFLTREAAYQWANEHIEFVGGEPVVVK